MKTITIINHKGGVGKTTTAAALASILAERGFHVLAVDLDPQGNLSLTNRVSGEGRPSSFGLFTQECKIGDAIQAAADYDIVPASELLQNLDALISNAAGKEYRLKEALQEVAGPYDFCIIDTPPSQSVVVTNALVASDTAVIPADAELYSAVGFSRLNILLEAIRKYYNSSLTIDGILITRYKANTNISRALREQFEGIAPQLHTRVYQTVIPENIAVVEAQAQREPLTTYAKGSRALIAYNAFVNELIGGAERGA